MSNIVDVENFKMVFGDKTVIKDLSFNVKPDGILGLLTNSTFNKDPIKEI
ncbi:MAG: hypothetical protein QM613_02870 [Micrococcaceae bacterium]